MKSTFAALACLLLAFGASADELRPLPPLLRTLSDEVGVMSIEEGRKLSRSLEQTLDGTGMRVMQVMPGKALPDIERELERAGTLRQLAPLFRAGRYFEALMKLNGEIERLLSRPAGRT